MTGNMYLNLVFYSYVVSLSGGIIQYWHDSIPKGLAASNGIDYSINIADILFL